MENFKWESNQTPVNSSALFIDYMRGQASDHKDRLDVCANSGCIPSIGPTIWNSFGTYDILVVYGRMTTDELNLYCEKSGIFLTLPTMVSINSLSFFTSTLR